MAACRLRPRPACRGHHRAPENRLWPQLLAARSRNRRSCAALRHSAHHRRRARLGRPQRAVLPLSALAGAIRSVRAHFVDQGFLLHNRTRLMIVVTAIDAAVTVVLTPFFIRYWGLVGAAGATVLAAIAAAIVSSAIGFARLGLTLPFNHLVPIALATTAMAALLSNLPEAPSVIVLAGHIGAGAALYIALLVLLYATSVLRMLRLPQQQSEP